MELPNYKYRKHGYNQLKTKTNEKFDKYNVFEYNWDVIFICFIFIIQKQNMKIPSHYKNLDVEEKRIVVANLISHFGNKEIQKQINKFSAEQIDFLFTYFFTESKEKREKMRYNMQTEYESTLKEIEYIAEKIQRLNIKYKELLAEEEDKKTFLKKK